MGQQHRAAVAVQRDDEGPETRHVAGQLFGPAIVTRRQCLRALRVGDPLGVTAQGLALHPDVQAGRIAAVEQLRDQGVGQGDHGQVRLLAEREAQAQRPMGGQVANQAVGQRLATIRLRVLRLIVFRVDVSEFAGLGVVHGVAAFVPHFGRWLVLVTDKPALDPGLPVLR